jgi:predicted RecA/RadA family phage recombinase
MWLAWKRVAREVAEGTLGGEFDKGDRTGLQSKVRDSEEAAKDQVWGDYRFAVVADGQEEDGLKVIDLGAGHSSSNETLCGRVITALKSGALLNESVGAGYIERNWPPALKESGAWPLASLRQSFLNGSLTRLVDPDVILRCKIVEFVDHGDFGLGSGAKTGGTYERVWFKELVATDEVAFEAGVFLLRKVVADGLKTGGPPSPMPGLGPQPESQPVPPAAPGLEPEPAPGVQTKTLRVVGTVPPEVWNRLGTRILPKLRSGADLKIGVEFSVAVNAANASSLASELRQILQELGLADLVRIE